MLCFCIAQSIIIIIVANMITSITVKKVQGENWQLCKNSIEVMFWFRKYVSLPTTVKLILKCLVLTTDHRLTELLLMNIMWTADIRIKWRCDHRSCHCDLSNRKVSLENVFGASTGFEPMASALALQCSTNWAMKTHMLGAGQFVEFIVPMKGMKHMNMYLWRKWIIWILCELPTYEWNEDVIIAVVIFICDIHMFHSFHRYYEFNKLACPQRMGLHSSVGGALQH